MITRRGVFSFLGLGLAVGATVPVAMIAASEAEAQTAGMERRHERRTERHVRRHERREGRHERRDERREGRQERRDDRRTSY